MATTYEAIATVTVGSGGAANIEFTSIPATYTDLLVKISARLTGSNEAILINFNNSSTNLSSKRLYGTGSATGSSNYGSTVYVGNATGTGDTASTFCNNEFYVPNYASSNNKSVSSDGVTENNGTTAYAILDAGLWSNSAAITSIKLIPNANNFAQYSTATLYGIKNS